MKPFLMKFVLSYKEYFCNNKKMSRSIKKHCGGKICGCSDKISQQLWHRSARRKVNLQLRDVEVKQNFDEIIFWRKKQEVSDNWGFASDGGSHHWNYYNFAHFYKKYIGDCYHGSRYRKKHYKIPTRKEVWKNWIKNFVGK